MLSKSSLIKCNKKNHKKLFLKMIDKYFPDLRNQMQETANNCFGSEKRNFNLHKAEVGKHEHLKITAKYRGKFLNLLKRLLKFCF